MNKVSAPSSGAILRQTRRVNKFYAQIASKFHQIDIHTNNKEKNTITSKWFAIKSGQILYKSHGTGKV